MRIAFFALVACGIVFGCDGGGGSTGTSGGGGGTASMCQAYCGWRDRCGRTEADCQAECTEDLKRSDGKLSDAYTSSFTSCFDGLSCESNDDTCVTNFAAAEPAYPNIPEIEACMNKRSECSEAAPAGDGGTGTVPTTTFADDYCNTIAALSAAARAEANACLSEPCAGIRDCLIRAGAFSY